MAVKKKNLARHLRSNMTLPEVLLWKAIQHDKTGFRIKRQYSFGDYILDFYCPELKVAIEVDGQIHSLKRKSDQQRDAYLASEGLTVLRYSAKAVLASPGLVGEQIEQELLRLKRKDD